MGRERRRLIKREMEREEEGEERREEGREEVSKKESGEKVAPSPTLGWNLDRVGPIQDTFSPP